MNNILIKKIRGYTFVPPILQEVQNVNNDLQLRTDVLNYYRDKIDKWIKKYYNNTHLESLLLFVKSKDGIDFIFSIIVSFINKFNLKWYDLRDNKSNYMLLKEYILKKLDHKKTNN